MIRSVKLGETGLDVNGLSGVGWREGMLGCIARSGSRPASCEWLLGPCALEARVSHDRCPISAPPSQSMLDLHLLIKALPTHLPLRVLPELLRMSQWVGAVERAQGYIDLKSKVRLSLEFEGTITCNDLCC